MISTSARHTDDSGSIPSHGRHGIFGVKTWLSTLGTVYLVNVGFGLNLRCTRTTEDDKRLGSDHPQWQHRKIGWRKCYETVVQ